MTRKRELGFEFCKH